ncbi:unnamed protein product [Rotaria sordida]|uniref:ABC transmembrane type-1 domain-containing protein n=1 Tax=Rotaria sordida TaxID=392033 RepID=A0A815T999_9BILA|nr:unnamed protein product [Rotaria sordida]CAF1315458.1 unnamed protein product [Rotaria sordida]CAF1504951.1 unnamed protein product [Rotaria sordida]CAF4053359.1 unnamed protein product [Rotaria sordida]
MVTPKEEQMQRRTNAVDIDLVDSALPKAISSSANMLISMLVTGIILVYSSWFIIIALVPLVILFIFIQHVYIASSRQLRRLESTTRSPIYSNFGETIRGLTSIRAYNAQQRFIDVSDHLLDRNQSFYLANRVANRWLAVRLEMIANILILITTIFVVLMRDYLTAGTIGLAITYAMQIPLLLSLLVRTASDIETNIISIERINEYAELKSEAPWEVSEKKPSPHWPTDGEIQILILSNGRLQEYGEPARLAANPESAFAKLLRDAKIRASDIKPIISSS